MTPEEIIEMAELAGFEMDDSGVLSPQVVWYIYHESLIKFAKLVAQHEREACAKYVESLYVGDAPLTTVMGAIGNAIRARGQA